MQQRGIRPETVEALLDHGREVPVEGGRDLVFFDRRARARLASTNTSNSYAILGSDGMVITVGHRFRRIPRRG
jgi:hypothetical protein